MTAPRAVTDLLHDAAAGKREALDSLLPLVYDEMRRLAARALRRERPGHTLRATALAHEAYLRLVDQREAKWQNRAHFLAVAAQAIRRILIDNAREHRRLKRGAGQEKLVLDDVDVPFMPPSADILALDEALHRLAVLDPRQSQIVELRFFGGLTVEETADVLQISPATIAREWTHAKAWLHAVLTSGYADE